MASPLRFLHGAETNVTTDGPVFFQPVNASIIGLVGTAPIHLRAQASQSVNKLELVASDLRAARLFGPHRPGFSLPSALRAIFSKTGAQILCVNIFDPATHKTDMAEAEISFAGDTIKLPKQDIITLTIKDQDGNIVYTENTHYKLDRANGVIHRLTPENGAITRDAAVKISYAYVDLTKVTSADIIGGVNEQGARTGCQTLLEGLSLHGRKPKLLGAPGFSSAVAVRNALQNMAHKLRGHCFIDAPIGWTPTRAITERGPNGASADDKKLFFTSDARTILCYPHIKEYDPLTDASVLAPYSQHLLGLTAKIQAELGLHYSPSNKEITGITGVERSLNSDFTDPNSEVNLLNEVGITTLYRGFGTGNRSWGNRTAAWPNGSTHVSTFFAVQAVSDMIAETLEINALQFIDRPLTLGLIDFIVKSVDAFLARLRNQGLILGGNCWFEADDNDPTQLSSGWLRFRVDQQAPPPAERITYEQRYNIGYLAILAEQAAATYGNTA